MWYAFDAVTGKAFHDRVKVIDRVEHPPLKAGRAGRRLPGLDRRAELLARRLRPEAQLHLQRCGRDGGRPVQKKLTPTQKKRKFLLGDIFLGLDNGNFGDYLPGWKDHGSISAIDVSTGKRVWKFDTPEPERGGVSLTATGARLRGRRRRRPPRVRLEDGQGALDVPDRPPDRRRADDLHRRRQGVRRDHGRWLADLVRRRPRVAAAGVRDRRQQGRVAEAAGARRRSQPPARRPRQHAAQAGARRRARALSTLTRVQRPVAPASPFRPGRSRSGSGTRTAPTSCR